jgi:dTDP-L-rhamnose 4-epimerase
MAIFACRLLNGRPPMIFEDGEQRRDFVNVRDVARAFRAAIERPEADGRAINVGSGRARSIADVAHTLGFVLGREDLEPQVEGKYRAGDVRHCFADIGLAESLLAYRPQVDFESGVEELAEWLGRQNAVDRASVAAAELERRGLTV